MVSAITYIPVLRCFLRVSIPPGGWFCIVASGLIHGVYFGCIGGAYQRGDLSLVYPLARGSGPLFIPLLAVLLLGEEISPLGGIGILFIIGGVSVTTTLPRGKPADVKRQIDWLVEKLSLIHI